MSRACGYARSKGWRRSSARSDARAARAAHLPPWGRIAGRLTRLLWAAVVAPSRCEGEPLPSAQGMFSISAMFLFLGAKSPVTFLTSVVDDVVVVASASALLGDVAGVEGAGLASCRSSAGLEGPCPSG